MSKNVLSLSIHDLKRMIREEAEKLDAGAGLADSPHDTPWEEEDADELHDFHADRPRATPEATRESRLTKLKNHEAALTDRLRECKREIYREMVRIEESRSRRR